MIQNLASRLAVIQENSSMAGMQQPLRKMGRHMASHSFLESLRRHGGGNPHLLTTNLPSSSLRARRTPWEALFTGDPNLHPFAIERLWNDPRRYSLIELPTLSAHPLL